MNPFNPGFSQFNGAPKPFASQFGRFNDAPKPFASPYSAPGSLFGGNRPPSMFAGQQQQLNAMNQAPAGPGFADRLAAFGQQMERAGQQEQIQHAQMPQMQMMQAPQLNPTQGGGGNIQALLQALYGGR